MTISEIKLPVILYQYNIILVQPEDGKLLWSITLFVSVFQSYQCTWQPLILMGSCLVHERFLPTRPGCLSFSVSIHVIFFGVSSSPFVRSHKYYTDLYLQRHLWAPKINSKGYQNVTIIMNCLFWSMCFFTLIITCSHR